VIIFGIDPGTSITGYGIIRSNGNTISYVASGIIKTNPKMEIPEKLEKIYDGLSAKMNEYGPDCVSIEQAFYGKNVNTTLVLGQARGVAILAAVKSGATVVEYTPREIKKAVVGNGNAVKEQVEYMVKMILRLPDCATQSDEYDALAASICAFNSFSKEKYKR
jgi:crossover junction endodeoxyribonuclease RuvC